MMLLLHRAPLTMSCPYPPQAGDELNKTAKDFHALNTQLKEELPRFNTLVCDIFRECVSQFTELYRNYYHESYKFILPMMQVTI